MKYFFRYNINEQDSENGATGLIIACEKGLSKKWKWRNENENNFKLQLGHDPLAQYLLEHGADVNIQMTKGVRKQE